jgi:hypothetical protein
LERIEPLVKLVIFNVIRQLFEPNSFDIQQWRDRFGSQPDESRRILIICSKNRGKISFDVFKLDLGSFPNLEDRAPGGSMLLDKGFDWISPYFIGDADSSFFI